MFTVNELATRIAAGFALLFGVGLPKPRAHEGNGYRRLFKKQDAQWLRFIHLTKRLGFTLNEIRQIAECADHIESDLLMELD